MKHELPIILGAGTFNSKERFPKKSITAKRKVKTFELEYFYESGGKSVINGKEYNIKKGFVLFAKPKDIRYSHLPFTCKYLHFTVSDELLCFALETMSPFFMAPDSSKTGKILTRIISNFYSANKFDNIVAACELVTLLKMLCEGGEEDLSSLNLAQRYIESGFAEDITTTDIARECNISVSYLHKIFKMGLDTTPIEYLKEIRISAAKDLLTNSNLSISEIAFRCGFNSQSYFSDSFKRAVGISPNSFRKNSIYLL